MTLLAAIALITKQQSPTSTDVHRGAYLRVDRQVRRRPPRQIKLRGGALLMPTADSLVPPLELHSYIVHKASYRGLVLVGIEEFWDRKTWTEYPQAWGLRIAAPRRR
jgi:hypothetical protein